jgi:hypothetical protein
MVVATRIIVCSVLTAALGWGQDMAVVARIIVCSVLTAALGACLGYALGFVFFGSNRDAVALGLLLSFAGSIVGAIARAAGEIVAAQRRLSEAKPTEPVFKTLEEFR